MRGKPPGSIGRRPAVDTCMRLWSACRIKNPALGRAEIHKGGVGGDKSCRLRRPAPLGREPPEIACGGLPSTKLEAPSASGAPTSRRRAPWFTAREVVRPWRARIPPIRIWCRGEGSNPGPVAYKATALPTELQRRISGRLSGLSGAQGRGLLTGGWLQRAESNRVSSGYEPDGLPVAFTASNSVGTSPMMGKPRGEPLGTPTDARFIRLSVFLCKRHASSFSATFLETVNAQIEAAASSSRSPHA